MRRRDLLATASGAAAAGLLLPGTARAATGTAGTARQAASVGIDPAGSWGAWEGWGTSLAWWANVFGERDDLADVFFTRRTVDVGGAPLPGLGLNLARYNLGACSWNAVNGERMVESPNIPRFKQIEGYWKDWRDEDPSSAAWDWSADAAQRAMLRKAHDRGAKAELFSNSPMWWMCLNHNPSGAASGSDNNLQPWNYRQFAVYLAEVARRSADEWGVPFVSVEAFNESTSDYWSATGKQEGCHFDAAVQEEVLAHLRRELNRRGLADTAVAASDETNYQVALDTWRSYGGAARDAVGRINVHGYSGSSGPRAALRDAAAAAGKGLWNSEYGDRDGTGLSMVTNLHLDLRQLRPSGWLYWQVIDETQVWALIDFDSSTNTLGTVRPKFYLLAQYTRHIRPGMRMIDTGDDAVVAAWDEGAGRLVVVAANTGNAAREVTLDLTAFGTVPADGTTVPRWATGADDGGERYAAHRDDVLRGGRLSRTLGARSVHTFEFDGVRA
ncbi:glycoside hydrolase [Streptomyces boncukensis]|uniref:Beta-1,6-galactanase n=1 Tax=Streptomyces boncukensis TaxID=2711219 RepID=A0A6G4WQA1_9ACTN|nr:glycoside hydrolase [Streptomyces boncukensis]NGO67193.1 beta-1,6-galactanase [Streptomyces boncukensis]